MRIQIALFILILLLAQVQGANASTISIDADKILNISGNRTYPVSMFQICNYFHDDLESCSVSLNKLSNFTHSDHGMSGTDDPFDNYWNITSPYYNTSKTYYSSYSGGSDYGVSHRNEPYFFGYNNYKEEPYSIDNYTTLYNKYVTIKSIDTVHPVFLHSVNYAISGSTYNASQVTDVLYDGLYTHRENCPANGLGQYRRPTTDPCSILYYYTDDFIFAQEYGLISNFLNAAGVTSIDTLPIAMYNTIQAINTSFTSDASMRYLPENKLRAISYWSITAGYQGLTYWGYKFYGGGTCDGCLMENATMTAYYNNFAGELTLPEIQYVLTLPTINYSWNYYTSWDDKVNFSVNPTRTINYTWAQTYKTGYALTYRLKYNATSNKYYLIVANKLNVSVSPTITIQGLTGTHTATTLGITGTGSSAPSQSHTVTNGVFTDTFDGYAAHVYEISNTTSANATTWTIKGSGGDATWSDYTYLPNTSFQINMDNNLVLYDLDDFNNGSTVSPYWSQEKTGGCTLTQANGILNVTQPVSTICNANVTRNFSKIDVRASASTTINHYNDFIILGINATSYYSIYRTDNGDFYAWSNPAQGGNLLLSGDNNYHTWNATLNGTGISFYVDGVYKVGWSETRTNFTKLKLGSDAIDLTYEGIRLYDYIQLPRNQPNVLSGNLTTWHNWTDGNVTYQVVVNATTPANTNYTIWGRQNATGDFQQLSSSGLTGNTTLGIGAPLYENLDVRIQLFGNETTTPELVAVTYYAQSSVTYVPSITSWNNSKVNNNDDAEVITGYGETYYHLVKTFTFTNTFNGNMNISFDMKSGNENNANAQVRKNGVLIGSTQSQSGNTYVTKNQDINVGIVNVGDTIELWLSSATAGYGYARNFGLLYDNANININTSENINFNAIANQTITTWNWYVNGTNQNNNYDNISLSYSTTGIRLIQVNATNSNGTSTTISWNLTIQIPDTSTKWTYGIMGNFFQNNSIGNNRTCINQGDGSVGVCKLADNFNDNNTDGWNETGDLTGTWLNQNGTLNQSGEFTSYQYWNLTSYENMSIFTKFKEYGNLSSYIDASDLRGNLSRVNANPSWLNCQFSIGSPTQTRAHIYCYNGSSWLYVNNTATKTRYLNDWNYAGFFANGTYFRGYLSNVSYADTMTSILSSGTSSQWLNGTTIQFGALPNSLATISWDEIRAVELDALGNQYLQGNYSMNYTVPASQYAKNITINGTYPSGTNYSLKYRQNATGDYIAVGGIKTADATIELPTPYYQSIDILFEMNASTSDTLWITNVTINAQATDTNTTPSLSTVTHQTCGAHDCIVTFTVNQSNAITKVKYGTNTSMTSGTTNQTSGTSRNDNLTSLSNNTLYYYAVWAWNSTNTSKYLTSITQSFTTAEDYVPPWIPAITSNLNNITGTSATSFSVNINNAVLFSAGANQTITTWSWTGATKAGGDGTTNTTALKLFTSTGIQSVSVYGTNSNGSTSTLTWTVDVVTGGGGGTDWDYLTGTVNVAGATITTNPDVGSTTGGAYSYGYVFVDGQTYWVNVSKAGYVSNNTQITFNEDHEVWNPVLTTLQTGYWNSLTQDESLYIHPQKNQAVTFKLLNTHITSTIWTKDGETQSETSRNYTTYFNTIGHHNISALGTTPDGMTPMILWEILAVRQKSGAGDVTPELNTPWFDTLIGTMQGSSPNFFSFINALMLPFSTPLGGVFYLFIYLLPLVVIWVRQEKSLIPVGLGIIFGGLLIGSLPAEWQLPMQLFIILTTLGVMYSLFKERG